MSDSNLQITFGADASAVTDAAAQTKTALGAMMASVKDLAASLKDLQDQGRTALQAVGKGASSSAAAARRSVADQLSATRAGLAEQIAAIQEQAEAGQISRSQEFDAIEALHGQENAAAEAAALQQVRIASQAIDQRLALEQGDAARTEADLAARQALWSQYQSQMVKLNADGLRQQDQDRKADLARFKSEWDGAINPLVSRFSTGLMQMAEGTKSFVQVMRGLGQQILQDFITNVVDKKIEAWLWGEAAQTGATSGQSVIRRGIQAVEALFGITTAKTTGAADIATSAAQAFAAAWASTAAIPIIGPALAPASASAAYAGAMSANGLLAAAGGFDVPSGVNPVTQLHAREMVLPARLANPLRDLLSSYSPAGAGAAASTSGGDTHNHYYNISAMDGPSFRGFLRGNSDHLSTVLQEMGRRGQRTG